MASGVGTQRSPSSFPVPWGVLSSRAQGLSISFLAPWPDRHQCPNTEASLSSEAGDGRPSGFK